MNILMVNLPFSGHTNPTLPLTRELVNRGHNVVYVNAESFREKIEHTGATFVPYKNYRNNASANYVKKHCFIAAFDTAMSLEETFDLLIYEMFFYPGIEISKRKGIPCVRQFSQPAWSEETIKEAPLLFRISAKLIDIQVLPKAVANRNGFENQCLKDGVIKSKPDLNIVYLPKEFQNKSDSFDEKYLFKIPKPQMIPSKVLIPYDKMKMPIIYISLGSIISDKSFYKKCIKAFGNKEFSVILNTGKISPNTLGELPDNIYAYSYVPQIEVLSHADVFLTHCGMNSINEALCFGVPMVAMPFFNDQITNAKQLVKLGLAKKIHSYLQNTKEIYQVVYEVSRDVEMKKNIERMSKAIENQMSWDSIIKRIDSIR